MAKTPARRLRAVGQLPSGGLARLVARGAPLHTRRREQANRDLEYEPIVAYDVGWPDTLRWFRDHWLPTFSAKHSMGFAGISDQSQAKIDVQAAGTGAGRPKAE